MKTIFKSALSLVLALIMVASVLVIPTFSAELTSITELDISKCSKIYFKGETNKDFTKCEVGEEMVFTMTLYADGKQICAPYFKYTITGDDGFSTSGFANAASGTVVLKATATKVGGVRVVVEPADASKKVISDAKITIFEGGAIAGASDVRTTVAEPLDFDEFWAGKLAELDECAPDLFSLEQVTSSNRNFDTYVVKVNCIGRPEMIATNATWTAGVLTVPKNAAAGSLGFRLTFRGYGVTSAEKTYRNGYVTFAVCAHSMEQLQDSSYYNIGKLGLTDYGYIASENADPNTSYFTYMLLRDVQAVRFLKKYFGTEGGEASFGGVNTGAWKGLWNGKDIYVSGGSQGGFQSVGVAALDSDVSYVSVDVPWFADVAGNTIPSRIQSTFRPTYADGLRYLDTALLAKRIKAPKVDITAGAGDPLCTMYAIQAIYNNLNVDNASLRFRQGGTHSSTNTVAIDFTQKKTKDSVAIPTDAFAIEGLEGVEDAFKDAWFALTGRNALIVESESDFSDAYDKNIYISLGDFSEFYDDGMTYEEICSILEGTRRMGYDAYAVGFTGEVTALTNMHKAVLDLAYEAESPVYLVAFGEDSSDKATLAETIAINLSGAIFENQPNKDVDYKLISENGFVSSKVVLAEDVNNVKVYPIAVPCYTMKNACLSPIYKSPEESGTENGIVTLLSNSSSKEFMVFDANGVEAFGEDAGVEWFVKDGILNIYGVEIYSDTDYGWNSYIDGITEVIIEDGIAAFPAYSFNMPSGAKIMVPFSVKNIDDNAFGGKTDFTIVSYEEADAKNFALEKGIDFESLGTRYISGNVLGYYSGNNIVDNLWTFDTNTKVLTVTSNKSGYNECGSATYKGGWKDILTDIEEVVLIGNMSKITGEAFSGAKNLRKVTMPALHQIDSSAFAGCKNLETVCISGRSCIEGVLDFSSITGSNDMGSGSFAKSDVFDTTVMAEGIILGNEYSESAPLVLGNLPDGISKIYGETSYLESFCAENNIEFVPFGRSTDNNFAWTIEDSTLTIVGVGSLKNLGVSIDKYANDVRKVVISKNVVEIANNAFTSLKKLGSVVFEGNAPRVANGAKPFGEQAEYFCIISGSKSEGFDEETWCGYTVYKIPYIAGDINDDGEINVRDAVLLAQYLAGWNVEINDSAADVNGDETVDIRDAVLLAQYLAGWNVELVGPPVPSIPDIPDEPVIPDEPDEPEESEDNEVLEDDI